MTALLIGLYLVIGLITVVLMSLASRDIENRGLGMAEIVLALLFWPYFLVALSVRLNIDSH